MDVKRQLVYRFCELPHVIKVEIAQKLDAIGDISDDPLCFVRVFQKAEQRGDLHLLWDLINNYHSVRCYDNPFLKCITNG